MTNTRVRWIIGAATAVTAYACNSATRAPAPSPAAAPAASPAAAPVVDTVQPFNDRLAQGVLAQLGARATQPAESVFQNVQLQWLKGIPARQLVNIMNFGYSRALGVRCTHCHVEGNFASDDKRPKRAAREMATMHRMINTELQKLQNLETPPGPQRFINCTTCHRGAVNPNRPG